MKIKAPTDFVSFDDGVCDIYTVDDEDTRTDKFIRLGFSDRTLGYNRIYAASAAQSVASRVIRIPQVAGVEIYDTAEVTGVTGVGKYRIEAVQTMFDTNPISIDLTLRQLEMFAT